mgnify:CR=1 FL=1
MKNLVILAAIAILPLKAVIAADYTVDSSHTYVSFSVNHLGCSTMRGKYNEQTGSLKFDPTAKKAEVMIEIEASSIDTGHAKRDEHLQSPDFLNAVENPTITFMAYPQLANRLKANISQTVGRPPARHHILLAKNILAVWGQRPQQRPQKTGPQKDPRHFTFTRSG